MNDPDTPEQYCSAYYDRHGSYNDGFPCPTDKYCCQNKDGLKYCCSLNSIQQEKQFNGNNHALSLSSSTIISRLNNEYINQQQSKLNGHKSLSSESSSSGLFNSKSSSSSSGGAVTTEVSLPILITNSTLLISICVGLFLLLSTALILYFCICRRCIKKKSSSTSSSASSSSSSSFDEKLTGKRSSNKRVISSAASSTTTSSSLTTPNALNIESGLLLDECHSQHMLQYHHNHHHQHHKTLTIDANHHHYGTGSTTKGGGGGSIHQHTNNYINSIAAMSSGSNNLNSNLLMNLNSISSPNTTQTSIATNSHQLNINDNIVDFHEFNEQDEPNEQDFILYTSNNLEFLKSHSLFNGKSPLNYYPSHSMRSSIKSPFDEPPAYSTNNDVSTTATNNNDLRFSTFLPPMYVKNHELL